MLAGVAWPAPALLSRYLERALPGLIGILTGNRNVAILHVRYRQT
jgi:hypothetical protein